MGDIIEDLMDKLESYLISCERVVTYKWISQEWNVHVNTAKQLLFSYADKEKLKEDSVNLEVVYFLSGLSKDSNGEQSYQVSLVREKDLPETKSKFKTIMSEHVYSIQKSSLKDLHDIYVIDKVDPGKLLQGNCGKAAVKCEAAVPRSSESLAKLRLKLTPAQCPEKSESAFKKTSKNEVKVDNNSCEEKYKNNDGKPEEKVSVVNGKVKKDDKKGIAGMFAAQSEKNTAKKSEVESENAGNKVNTKNISKKPAATKNGIANFFAKQAERPPMPKTKKEEPKTKEKPEKKVEPKKEEPKMKEKREKKVESKKEVIVMEEEDPFASEDEVDCRIVTIEDDDRKSPIKSVMKGKERKKEKPGKKKRSTGSEGEEESPLPNKKRRRIKMMSSSDDSGEEEMEIGESESPLPSPKVAPKGDQGSEEDDDIIPATPLESLKGNSKKRRKRTMINRTFADDDGYIVTKKEFVFVSCTDDSSQSGDDIKKAKKESKCNGNIEDRQKIVSQEEANGKNKEKESKTSANDSDDVTSPKEQNEEKKGKKNKETSKGKKPTDKKISPQNTRQGVLTSFFKRS